jgi:UDP-N-acetylmuramoyl-tripeptide--D-alanyl-D-alanine ligase
VAADPRRFNAGGVCFDSREVIGGELFVALKGETTDGHRFHPDCARTRCGRRCWSARQLTHRMCWSPTPLPHLDALGRAARSRTAATVIGVTGSVGKTGVKEALRAALDRFAPGHTHASVKVVQ